MAKRPKPPDDYADKPEAAKRFADALKSLLNKKNAGGEGRTHGPKPRRTKSNPQ